MAGSTAEPFDPGLAICQSVVDQCGSLARKQCLQFWNILEINPKYSQPIRDSVSRNAAQRKYLINAGRERGISEIVVEVVGKEIRRTSAIKGDRVLRNLVESQSFVGKN